VIYEVPVADLSTDMTIESYMRETTLWAIEIQAWVDEMINQVVHSVPHVDMRK
jgi:hypothetical protein